VLQQLHPRKRRLVESVLADKPGMTAAEAIKQLRTAGM
jgi:hypothetical protein